MNELTTRAGKSALLFALGVIVISAAFVMPGSVRERALDRRVEAALRVLADGESYSVPSRDAEDAVSTDRTWWNLEGGGVIVRDQVEGYQSFLDILLRFDEERDLVRFHIILENEGAHVKPALSEGDRDALSGATVTAEAINRAVTRIQRDMLFNRGESR